jgi:hypothetical protein
MPRLWFVHDGVASPAAGPSPVSISFTDFNRAFGARAVRFVSDGPTSAQVLLEIDQSELAPPLFGRPGFYLVEHLSPGAAQEQLKDLKLL